MKKKLNGRLFILQIKIDQEKFVFSAVEIKLLADNKKLISLQFELLGKCRLLTTLYLKSKLFRSRYNLSTFVFINFFVFLILYIAFLLLLFFMLFKLTENYLNFFGNVITHLNLYKVFIQCYLLFNLLGPSSKQETFVKQKHSNNFT